MGLKLTTTGIVPSDHILSAIKNFTKATDLTNARSWCGLVNQIAWAYSTSPIRELFQELVKHKATFQWNSTLDQLFQQSNKLLISKVEEGITTFDIYRPMCLQTDWSKTGIGYLLLQKYCQRKSTSYHLHSRVETLDIFTFTPRLFSIRTHIHMKI